MLLKVTELKILVRDSCERAGVNALYIQNKDDVILFYADVPKNIGWKLGGLYEDLKDLFPQYNMHFATKFEDQSDCNTFLRDQVKVYDCRDN